MMRMKFMSIMLKVFDSLSSKSKEKMVLSSTDKKKENSQILPSRISRRRVPKKQNFLNNIEIEQLNRRWNISLRIPKTMKAKASLYNRYSILFSMNPSVNYPILDVISYISMDFYCPSLKPNMHFILFIAFSKLVLMRFIRCFKKFSYNC